MLHSGEFFQTLILIVKPAFDLPRALPVAVAFACLLTACGQRGPLYLPSKPAPISTAPAPQTAPPLGGGMPDGATPALGTGTPAESK